MANNKKLYIPIQYRILLAVSYLLYMFGLPILMQNGFWFFFSAISGSIIVAIIQQKMFQHFKS